MAVATDMGHFDQYIIEHLQGLDAVLLESNHDVRMLETGPYPYYLKRRILGDHGHLSNETAGRLLNCILHDKLKKIFLGHLSKKNNYEELAYETVRLEIDEGDSPYGASDFSISVAGRDQDERDRLRVGKPLCARLADAPPHQKVWRAHWSYMNTCRYLAAELLY